MDASTVGDLFERDRRTERPALEDDTGRVYDYHWLCTSSWKAGNFLRHSGVRRGVTVGVVGDGPLALLAFFGTALLEGTTRFEPPADLEREYGGSGEAGPGTGTETENDSTSSEFRALVAPVDTLETYTLPQGAQRVGYGRKPDDPAVHHFDAGLWSENPSFPTLEIDPETPLLSDGGRRYTHGAVLQAAHEVVDEWGIDDETRVCVTDLADPRAVTAGVIAPLVAGGTIVLPNGESESPPDTDSTADDAAGTPADVVVDHGESNSHSRRNRIDCSSVELSS